MRERDPSSSTEHRESSHLLPGQFAQKLASVMSGRGLVRGATSHAAHQGDSKHQMSHENIPQLGWSKQNFFNESSLRIEKIFPAYV